MLVQRLNGPDPQLRILSKSLLFKFVPLLVLAASLTVTWFSWKIAQNTSMSRLKSDFEYRVLDVTSRLDERLQSYEQVLVGVQALFDDLHEMDALEFRSYVDALHLEHTFPGIHNLMFARVNVAGKFAPHRTIHVEQFPGYNQRAFGYDVLADAKVRSAIERAIDSGKITVTGNLPMTPGDGGIKRTGFLMFVPVYLPGSKHDTPAERRANYMGWAAGTFLMRDLMAGILGESAPDLDIEIFYGKQIADNALLYDTDFSRALAYKQHSWFRTVRQVSVSSYPWTLKITSQPGFEAQLDQSKPLLIAGSGLGISALLALLVRVLVRGRENALRYARQLDASQNQLRAILDNSPIGIWYSGKDGRYRFVNKEFCRVFGMAEQLFLDKRPSEIFGSDNSRDFTRTGQFCLTNETALVSRETLTFADGKPHLLQVIRVMLVDDNGMDAGTIGIMNDITEASALQQALKKSRDELEVRVQERTRDLEQTARKLEREMQQRKQLERNLLEVSEEAQAQIGRELHDDLGQLLSGAAYLAGSLAGRLAASDPEAGKQAESIKKIAQDAVKHTRYITHSLVPFGIASRGLKQGLEQFAEDVLQVSGIPCEVECIGEREVTDLTLATNLYRIVQEAINNAVKHSQASHLSIRLDTSADDEIRLAIADDGVGLPGDYREKSKGMGLMNMNYRAQLIGASISIESNEGKGTRILLVLPTSAA